MFKRPAWALFVALILIVAAAPAVAALQSDEFLGGKVRTGDTITVPASETVDGDLYIFAGTVTVDGVVKGDLIAFGGQIDVNGTVEGDVIISGGTLTVPGDVVGDVRAAGGQITVSGDVAEDAVLAGGQTRMSGTVAGDFIFASGQATVSGDVVGDVLGSTGDYSMSGAVGGIEDVTIAEEPVAEATNPFLSALQRAISVVIFGALLLWLFSRRSVEAADRVVSRWWESALWGLGFVVSLIVVPLVIIFAGILLAILAGIAGLGQWVGMFIIAMLAGLVLVGVAAFVGLVFVAPATVGTAIGELLLPDLNRFIWMALGVIAIVALGLVPILGPIVAFVVAILGTGAWFVGLRKREEPAAYVAPEPDLVSTG